MKLKSGLAIESVDDEVIILDQEAGEVHQLNESAALVWNALSAGQKTDEIVANLCETFAIEHEQAASDVQTVLGQLEKLGLIVE